LIFYNIHVNQSFFLIFLPKIKSMRNLIYTVLILLTISLSSCRKDFSFETSSGELRFSKDTVFLDTVFKNIGSSTYQLKVYNKSNNDISIPTIQLGKGLSSKYRMIVDGLQGTNGKIFKNVELLAKDSLFIFIETTADILDANPTDFLYTDKILFGDGVLQQKVELVTLIQDAYFIYPKKNNGIIETVPIGVDGTSTVVVNGRDLINNHPDNGNEFVWNNTKPYVVYGYASVPSGQTLTVNPGARIHFHTDSGLIVQNDASLNIAGTPSITDKLENEVIFEGDRLEPFYSDVPGQWGFVYLRQGSKNNRIRHLTLKNATVGLLISNTQNTTTIKETQIYDCSNLGIYAQFTQIVGENIVVNSAGQAALACTVGGNYNFKHCTFNNNWPSTRQFSVLINDYVEGSTGVFTFQPVEVNLTNCIIFGSNSVALSMEDKDSGTPFNYVFSNCIIKFSNQNLSGGGLYNFSNIMNYKNCLISSNTTTFNPKFKSISKNQLNITETSAAINKGINLVPNFNDILNVPRPTPPNTNPDIGAYQFKPN
jgi:hypothetical protein